MGKSLKEKYRLLYHLFLYLTFIFTKPFLFNFNIHFST
jgi:hypothetical protein